MKILSLFPLPVYVDTYASNPDLVQFLDDQPLKDNGKAEAVYTGTHSIDTQILRSDQCKELRHFILQSSLIYAREYLGYDVKEMVDVLSWVTKKNTEQQHALHRHLNSFVSGVYYYTEVAQKTPLIFERPRASSIGSFEMDIAPAVRPFPDTFVPFSDVYKFRPVQGDLVLFPSFLDHRVPVNHSKEMRNGLAFNIMPTAQLGSRGGLSLFKYHVD